MKLIDEIIDLLSNTDTELENALIKAQVLAHKLGEKEIGAWIKSELVGYEDPTTVPEYRILNLTVFGNGQMVFVDIPITAYQLAASHKSLEIFF